MNNLITKEQLNYITNTCDEYSISRYKINKDGSIDVDGNVDLSNMDGIVSELPLIFNEVKGYFHCQANYLNSLKGAPKKVGGDFLCHENSLTSLEFSPIEVGGKYDCADNRITSLVGMPKEINGNLLCDNNRLESFIGGPCKVGGTMINAHTNNMTSLIGAPTLFIGDFNIDNNRLPKEFFKYFKFDSFEEISIFLKYQEVYDVWTPEFNEANMAGLVDDIKDGLR